MASSTRWAAVIGDPIAHSWSPLLHNRAYRELGVDIDYCLRHVTPDQLPDFVAGLDDTCAGVSVTMPHKQAIMPLCDKIDGLASLVGAVNTVVPSGGLLAGFNTDVAGIVDAIRQRKGDDYTPRNAVIIGARATASSALIALYGDLKCHNVTICARSVAGSGSVMESAARTSHIPAVVRLSDTRTVIETLNKADLIISTVPAHVMDKLATHLHVTPSQTLLDVVYSPLHTTLATTFRRAGATVVPGWLMLVHQAVRQIKLFSSHSIDPQILIDELVRQNMIDTTDLKE